MLEWDRQVYSCLCMWPGALVRVAWICVCVCVGVRVRKSVLVCITWGKNYLAVGISAIDGVCVQRCDLAQGSGELTYIWHGG